MRRRTFVKFVSAGAIGGLAGCTTPGGGGDGEETTTTETTTTEETETTEAEGAETEATTTAGEETTGETTTGGGGDATVEMVTDGSEYYFDPIGLAVEPGTTVTFVNETGAHSSTAYAEGNGGAEVTRIPDDAEPWDSGTLTDEGATFEHTFDVEGTYDYFCIPHKSLEMVGRIVVGEPGGPADGDMPPDGDVPESGTIVDQGSVSYDEF